jgi:integrase
LRHTFAVNRLLAWYQDGGDVQARLPLLATYLGHVSIVSTQVYLDITAELLQEAARRFKPPRLKARRFQGASP